MLIISDSSLAQHGTHHSKHPGRQAKPCCLCNHPLSLQHDGFKLTDTRSLPTDPQTDYNMSSKTARKWRGWMSKRSISPEITNSPTGISSANKIPTVIQCYWSGTIVVCWVSLWWHFASKWIIHAVHCRYTTSDRNNTNCLLVLAAVQIWYTCVEIKHPRYNYHHKF